MSQVSETVEVPAVVREVLTELLAKGCTQREAFSFVHEQIIAELESFQKFSKLPAEKQCEVIKQVALLIGQKRTNQMYDWGQKEFGYSANASTVTRLLVALVAVHPLKGIAEIADVFEIGAQQETIILHNWPFQHLVTQALKLARRHCSQDDYDRLNKLLSHDLDWHGPVGQANKKLKKFLIAKGEEKDTIPPYRRLSGDPFGEHVSAAVGAMPESHRGKWHQLFHHCAEVTGSKPTEKFRGEADRLIEEIGVKTFKPVIQDWLRVASTVEVRASGGSWSQPILFTDSNKQLLKGLIWTLIRFHDEKMLQLIADLAAHAAQKLPGVGPAAQSTVNACLFVLAGSRGLVGVSHLSRLKLRIKQTNTQRQIQKYIDDNAAKQGLKSAQIEEIAAPDFGLDAGQREWAFEDYTLRLTVSGPGRAELAWLKPDGKPQKTVPAFVKASAAHSDRLKAAKALQKQVKTSGTVQRDRIDRLYVEDMAWGYGDFCKYYRDHGLVSTIARKLIWMLEENGTATSALFQDGVWQDVAGNPVEVSGATTVRMWHPVDEESEKVLAWRERLEALGITQPLKQAYREIYLLTEAELSTATYSNRMAAHIIKQHQFNTLAAIRGWQFSLLGAYDDGRDGDIARKELPAHGLRAEYWIDEILDDQDHFNDAGIWLYVATDQVRLVSTTGESSEGLPLVDVPKIVLSEVMRDVDLFVGVASVGNDPNWLDNGGAPRQHDRYWHDYSFGDLTEVAKTRKIVLERLLPKLKIRDVAHIDGKFLIVDGKRHSYKIHIGSGNILIAPQDRYLCIVPGRGADKATDKLYLPFEGDRGLSIVLSKAFLLADDDKIADQTILSQL